MNGKTVLITGGTGSLGHELTKQVLEQSPKSLIILCHSESKRVEMGRAYKEADFPISYRMGDIRDEDNLIEVMSGVDCVIHAAALKHVDVCEREPDEVVKTNVLGALNVKNAAIKSGVGRVLGISTDKAVSPISIYGAAKLTGDIAMVQASNDKTMFAVARFGNFIGSSGSVIPHFKELAKQGAKDVPVTDKDMTRFFIPIESVAEFCLMCLKTMTGGEIFTPKMSATKIIDLAKSLHPKGKVKIIGIRDGEKLHEDLIVADLSHRTYDMGTYFMTLPRANGKTPVAKRFQYSSRSAV